MQVDKLDSNLEKEWEEIICLSINAKDQHFCFLYMEIGLDIKQGEAKVDIVLDKFTQFS